MSFLKKILGEDRDDIEEENVEEVETTYQSSAAATPKPVSNQRPKPEFVLIKPDKRDDIAMIADNLLKRKTVILNLELVTKDTRRFVDFLSGVAYALGCLLYTSCVLFLEIDCSDIDINVHPSKQEIKFSDESVVKNALTKAINKALIGDTGIVPIIKEPVIEVKPVVTPQQEVKKYDDWEIISNKMNVADIIQNVVDNTDQQPYAEISENDTVTITYPVYEQKHLEPIEIKPITVELSLIHI